MKVIETNQLKARAERVPSTIQFPTSDIGDALAVAEGLLKGGGMPLSRDQLGAAMNQVPNSGNFNTKVAGARIFGVMDTGGGKYQLTELGHDIVDPARQREALIQAFLNVPLYKQVYEEFRGKRLPPRPHGLEQAFMKMGVSPKQAQPARLAFEKSARIAGFYPAGDEDRLVIPFGAGTVALSMTSDVHQAEAAVSEAVLTASGVSRVHAISPDIHKSILGMLDELPAPKTEWAKADQADWLEAVATLFQVIYKSEDRGSISVSFTPE